MKAILHYRNSPLLPLSSILLNFLALPWVGYTYFIWIALVPFFLFLSSHQVSRSKLWFYGTAVLICHMFFSAYPFLNIEGAWWAGTHDLNRYLRENLQYSLVVLIVAALRTLLFLPIIPMARGLLNKQFGVPVLALGWIGLEWLYATYSLWGNTTGVLGYSVIDTVYIRSLAAFGGVYLLSFAVIVVSGIITQFIIHRGSGGYEIFRRVPLLFPLAALIVLLLVLGFISERLIHREGKNIHVAVIGNSLSTLSSVSEEGYRSYRKELTQALASEPELVLFPENAFPYFELEESDNSLRENTLINFPNRNALYDDLLSISRLHASTTLAIGMHTTREKKHYNSLILMKKGEVLHYYNKRVLVPFTEYAPFGLRIPLAVKLIAGKEIQQLNINGLPTGVLICSEIANTEILNAIPLILAPSNDSVLSGEYAASMHQTMARMRAIEHGAYLLRANKGGVSSIIDPNGNVIANTTDGVISATLHVAK